MITITVHHSPSMNSHLETKDMQIDAIHVSILILEVKKRCMEERQCLYCGEEDLKVGSYHVASRRVSIPPDCT